MWFSWTVFNLVGISDWGMYPGKLFQSAGPKTDICTYIHTNIHIYTHAYIHMYMHKYKQTYIHIHTRARKPALTHSCSLARMHTSTQAHLHIMNHNLIYNTYLLLTSLLTEHRRSIGRVSITPSRQLRYIYNTTCSFYSQSSVTNPPNIAHGKDNRLRSTLELFWVFFLCEPTAGRISKSINGTSHPNSPTRLHISFHYIVL